MRTRVDRRAGVAARGRRVYRLRVAFPSGRLVVAKATAKRSHVGWIERDADGAAACRVRVGVSDRVARRALAALRDIAAAWFGEGG